MKHKIHKKKRLLKRLLRVQRRLKIVKHRVVPVEMPHQNPQLPRSQHLHPQTMMKVRMKIPMKLIRHPLLKAMPKMQKRRQKKMKIRKWKERPKSSKT
jgi:hypothetical protein